MRINQAEGRYERSKCIRYVQYKPKSISSMNVAGYIGFYIEFGGWYFVYIVNKYTYIAK